uniref:Uncharacterized protein n=1 Tax=Ananas comosus var. bracteatus TaxID=296719 RepID=A0A6V7NW06_ANACO|nr:unnamed protein product [Ananas comosus var. bracteatus]
MRLSTSTAIARCGASIGLLSGRRSTRSSAWIHPKLHPGTPSWTLRRCSGMHLVWRGAAAAPSEDKWDVRRKPRLLIISRKNSRTFLNEQRMADMASSLGFDVRVGEPDMNTDVAKFARLVVPYGGLEWLAKATFKEPSEEMEIHYMEYMIQLDETTLSEQYPPDHPVLKDPYSIHKQGGCTQNCLLGQAKREAPFGQAQELSHGSPKALAT